MQPGHRQAEPSTKTRRERRRPDNANCRRFVDAWGNPEDHRGQISSSCESPTPWRRLRELSATRTGRIVILAPIGALGAYLLLRRRR